VGVFDLVKFAVGEVVANDVVKIERLVEETEVEV